MRETRRRQASLPGDHRALEPPDSIPNSVVKRCIADGSVGSPHVRVGHRQASKRKTPVATAAGVLLFGCDELLPLHRVHVTTPAPQVRGWGAAGVAQRLPRSARNPL